MPPTSSRHCRPLRLAMKMPVAISHYFWDLSGANQHYSVGVLLAKVIFICFSVAVAVASINGTERKL